MSYAVIQARDFGLQALRRTEPALMGVPLALLGPKLAVAQVSAEAAGVEPGMDAPLAMARCPGVVLRPGSPAAEAEAQALLLAAAFALSPRVESTAPGSCSADLRGADLARTRLRAESLVRELAASGLGVTVGIGRTVLLAAYAAAGDAAAPVRLVEEERAFLAPLPLAGAGPTPAQAEILARWGVRTLGALTALPKTEIGRRLGPAGVALWERAAGETERLLDLVKPPERFAAEWVFAPPVETIEPLLFILRRLVERLLLELRNGGWVAGGLTLILRLDNDGSHAREFPLPEPSGEAERLFRIVHTHLEHVRTDATVAGLSLAMTPARPLVKQPGLFDTGLKDPHGFAESLARVGAVVGPENVGTPELADSHRPEAFRLKAPEEAVPPAEVAPVHPPRGPVLRRFRPPPPVRVEWAGTQPQRLEGEQFRGAVTACRGPWRESGEWWGTERWARETWEVELAGGGLYLLARTPEGWRVEGMLD